MSKNLPGISLFFTLIFAFYFGAVAQEDVYLNNAEYTNGKEKLPHRLKKYEKPRSYKCKRCKEAAKTNVSCKVQYGMVYLTSNQAMDLKKVFRRRRDGVVIEYVGFDQYKCTNPEYPNYKSRWNETGSINGHISEPIYKKEIMKVLRKEKREFKLRQAYRMEEVKRHPDGVDKEKLKEIKAEKFNVHFFELGVELKPRFPTPYVTENVLIIHKRRIHFPKYKPESCGDEKVEVSLKMIPKDVNYPYAFDMPKDARVFTFKNFYRRGETQITDSVFQAIHDSIEGWHIDDIHINSFSSVEGFDTINERYHNERAENVRIALKQFYKTEPQLTVKSKENWAIFRSQVKNSSYKSWLKLSKSEIKERLTDPKYLHIWDPMLDEQRFSEITLTVSYEETDTLSYVLNKMRFPAKQNFDKVKQYHQYLKDKHPAEFAKIKYPDEDQYEDLLYDQLDVYLRNMNDKDVTQLRTFTNLLIKHSKTFNSDLLFLNVEIFVIKYADVVGFRKAYRPQAMERINDLIKSSSFKDDAMKLKVAYYLTYIPKMSPATQYKEIMEGCDFVSDYYYYFNDSIFYNTERLTDIIDFFVYYRTDLAVLFLDKYFEELKLFDPYLYAQYLKLLYNHPKHFNNRDYVRKVIEAKEKLTDAQWCDLFIGKCNINFQLFDDAELRKLYCESCGNSHYLKQFLK